MKIQVKGTKGYQAITPDKWAEMERLGTDKEYNIIERNTVWAEQIDDDGKRIGAKREFEKEHWKKMLALGDRLRWISIDMPDNNSTEQPKDIKTDKPQVKLSAADLQVELTQEQIKLTRLQQKELNNKLKYFIFGLIAGLLSNLPDIVKFLRQIFQ